MATTVFEKLSICICIESPEVVRSCGRKIFDVNSSEIAAECLKMFGVTDVAEAVAKRKDRFVKRYVLSSSVVCEICTICTSCS